MGAGSRIAARSSAAVIFTSRPDVSVLRITASGPSSSRTRRMASLIFAALKVRNRMGLSYSARSRSDLPKRADLRLGMDLVLRHHHGRRAESFDDRADEGANARA